MTLFGKLWKRFCPQIPFWKTIYGVPVMMDLRDNVHWLMMPADQIQAGERWFFPEKPGRVWDIGCNVGVYSVAAALNGHTVNAFDISAKAVYCLEQTASINNLKIYPVCIPITVTPKKFLPRPTSHTEEKASFNRFTGQDSWTYSFAADFHGMPDLIKMDIEGDEAEFLLSSEFKQWIQDNRITYVVEIHGQNFDWAWKEMERVDKDHFIYKP